MSEIKIPDKWLLTKFMEVLDVQGGTQPPKSQFIDKPKEGYIRLLQIRDFGAKPVPTYIPETPILKRCNKNDLLIGRYGASLGRICSGMEGVYNVALAKVISGNSLNKRFLKHYLESEMFQQPLAMLSRSAQNGFNKEDLATFDFVLPPLAEQKVVAEKLDSLLAQVEANKVHLEHVSKLLKIFRQSVFASAATGKLTEDWREKNHFLPSNPDKGKERFKKDLFNSSTQSLPELPNEWIVVPAASVLEYVTSGSRGWANYYADDGALFLRMSNVRYDSTKLDLNDLQYVNLPESVEGKRSLVRKNDIVISITADIGRVARIDLELEEAYVNQHLALLRPTKDINAEYLATCIAAVNIGVKQVQTLKRGATKAGLGLDDIRSLAIPFPSIEEQVEIVHRVEELFTFAGSIEQQVNAALACVNSLTQSILAKAFRGELTADWRAANPKLISDDNSAEALLEKIKIERESIAKQPKPRPNTVKKKTGSRMSKQIIKVTEALKQARKSLSGQQLLAAAGYPSDSSTEQLELFFLDIRDALTIEKSIVKLKRRDGDQDWFALANTVTNE